MHNKTARSLCLKSTRILHMIKTIKNGLQTQLRTHLVSQLVLEHAFSKLPQLDQLPPISHSQ